MGWRAQASRVIEKTANQLIPEDLAYLVTGGRACDNGR